MSLTKTNKDQINPKLQPIKGGKPSVKSERENGVQQSKARTDEWSNDLVAVGLSEDRQAFARLFNHFAPLIKGYFLSNHGSSMSGGMVEELIQEVMLKVWVKAKQFNPDKAAASTWLFTMARNTRIDMLRRKARHNNEPLETEDIWSTDEEESPVSVLQQHRNQASISDAVETLPTEQAQIVKMIYMEGKTHSVVAEDLQLPLGTVKSRLRLALSKMKIQIAPSGNELI